MVHIMDGMVGVGIEGGGFKEGWRSVTWCLGAFGEMVKWWDDGMIRGVWLEVS